ncbi:MAG: hypothetical protein ACQEXV_19660 [Bacillota bacterium]
MVFGFVNEGEFYEILVNINPITFKENLKPQIARLPLPLQFGNDDEQNFVLISYEKTGSGEAPEILERSGKIPEHAIAMLLKGREGATSFSSSVGGSVNYHDLEPSPPI